MVLFVCFYFSFTHNCFTYPIIYSTDSIVSIGFDEVFKRVGHDAIYLAHQFYFDFYSQIDMYLQNYMEWVRDN